MVAMIQTHNIAKELEETLLQLDGSIEKMERIIQEEREAAHLFAGEDLERLFDERARCQSTLVELESRCRRIMLKAGARMDTPLEQFMVEYVDADVQESLQHTRVQVAGRLEAVREATEENKILLHAAWSVTTHVLHELGAMPVQDAYGTEAAVAYGGMR